MFLLIQINSIRRDLMMRNSVLIAAGAFLLFSIFKRRYRLLNSILRNSVVRKLVVQLAMQLPFLREQFMRQAFK